MPPPKSGFLSLRIDPGLKEAIKEAAQQDNRTVANWVETVLRQRCQELGIPIPEQRALFNDGSDETPQTRGNT